MASRSWCLATTTTTHDALAEMLLLLLLLLLHRAVSSLFTGPIYKISYDSLKIILR